jgi:hypothetical protein
MKLQPRLVLRHALAGQARPVDCLLSFLDMLFGGATLIIEADDPVRLHWHVGYNKTDTRKQLAGMPLDLRVCFETRL